MELRCVTLNELKAQMREDWNEEDELIKLYGVAAEAAVIDATRRTFDELCTLGYAESTGFMPDDDIGETLKDWFPSRLKVAVLMLAAHYFRNREPVASVAQNPVPYTIEFFVKPYRKLKEEV
jgi:uncharacterized phage protein (predicted DNA packaging)